MGVPFQRGDRIDLASYSSAAAPFTLYANIRRFGIEQPDSYRTKVHVPNSDRTFAVTNNQPLGAPGTIEGFVLERRDSGVTIPRRGQCYVFVQLVRGGGPVITNLSTGYWYDPGFSPSLGEIVESGPGGGNGFLRVISLGDPAAGADYAAEVVPVNALWKVRGFAGTLVTDANAANRQVRIDYTDGTDVYGGTRVGGEIIASRIQTLRGAIGGVNSYQEGSNPLNGEVISFALPDTLMEAGDEFAPATANKVAGDDWGEGFIQVEEWIAI